MTQEVNPDIVVHFVPRIECYFCEPNLLTIYVYDHDYYHGAIKTKYVEIPREHVKAVAERMLALVANDNG